MWIDDELLLRCDEPLVISSWIPVSSMVVLGSSNDPRREAQVDACARDGIPVLKRYGGGGTVLLHPGCVVLSVGTWVQDPFANDRYFRFLNQSVIDALAAAWLKCAKFEQRGHSDIVLGEKKLAGTSLFRSRNYLLYQASILVYADAPLIDRYLAHPSREPDYRRGRNHSDFLIGLSEIIPQITVQNALDAIRANITECVRHHLRDDLIAPLEKHIPHVKNRARAAMS